MILRCKYQNSSEVGVFANLTNKYCLIGVGMGGQYDMFYSIFEQELHQKIPLIQTTVSTTKVVGSMTAGNSKGILLPSVTTESEIAKIKSELPESVKVGIINDSISALGNCISCNDSVALVHPEFSKESEEIIENILGVEVFKTTIAQNPLVGTYSVFNNNGGIVHPQTTIEEYEELANLMQVQIGAATVNRGSEILGSGVVVNDSIAFCGFESTSSEMDNFEKIFKISQNMINQ